MDIRRAWKVAWPWLLDLAVMILAGWLMLGCTGKRLVTDNIRTVHDTVYVSHGKTDSVRLRDVLRDSIVTRYKDSVVIVKDTLGKVVERYEWHYGNRDRSRAVGSDNVRLRTDTLVVYKNKTDTAYVTRIITAQPMRKHKGWLVVVLAVLALAVAGGVWLKMKCVK